jgi:predicted HTH domain antitoxin
LLSLAKYFSLEFAEDGMSMISFEVPDGMLTDLNETNEEFTAEVRIMAALELFRKHRLSLGKAAQMAGLSRVEFMGVASRQGVPIVDYDPSELDKEISGQ